MKWVLVAVIGWLLVMASVYVVGGVLDSARRMVSAPAGVESGQATASTQSS